MALTSKQELAEKHNCLRLECGNFESQLRLAEQDASSSAKHRDELAQEHWQHAKRASELLEKSQQQERAAEEFQRRFEEMEIALEAAILAKERMEARAVAAEGDMKAGQVWVAGFTQLGNPTLGVMRFHKRLTGSCVSVAIEQTIANFM